MNRARLITKQVCRHLHLRSKSGAMPGSPTRLACLEDKSLKRSASTADFYHRQIVKDQLVGDLGIEPRFFCAQDRRITTFQIPEKAKGPNSFESGPEILQQVESRLTDRSLACACLRRLYASLSVLFRAGIFEASKFQGKATSALQSSGDRLNLIHIEMALGQGFEPCTWLLEGHCSPRSTRAHGPP